MAHIHGVFDTDTHFVLDPIEKKLTVADGFSNVKVIQHDHNSERFTFEIPRYIEGHDMSTCNVATVHYLNVDGSTKEESADIYEIDDLQISPENEDLVICSWLISRHATKYVGALFFVLRFECVNDGESNYALNTLVYEGVRVGKGLFNSEIIVEEYGDILTKWKAEVDDAIANVGQASVTKESVEKALGYTPSNFSGSYNDLKDKPFYSYDGEGKVVYSETVDMPTSGSKSLTSEPFNLVVGDKYKVTWNGTEYVCVARKASLLLDESIMDVFQLGNRGIKNALVPSEDTGEPFLFEWGYANGVFGGFIRGAKNIDVIIEVAHIPTEHVPLPTEYLPEGVPYLSKELVELLPETETNTLPSDDDSVIIPGLELLVGETYVITLNGTEYECIGQDLSMMQEGAVLIGNPSIYGMDDNGLPFVIVALPGMGGVFMELSGKLDNTLSIHKGTVKKRKLPMELLPDEVIEFMKIVNGSEVSW